MPLQLRRGSETTISALTPANGEPLWAEDTHKLFIGDGTTVGGHEIGGGGGGGAQGAQGYQGYQGSQGAQGIQGAQGNQGDTGAQGLQGAQGLSGGFTSGSDAVVGILTATNRIHVDKIYNYEPTTASTYLLMQNDESGNLNLNVGQDDKYVSLGSYILEFQAPRQSIISGYNDLRLYSGVKGADPSVSGTGIRLNIGDNSTGSVQILANSAGGTETTIASFSTASITAYTHIIPNTDDTYDLGTSDRKWRSLYVGTDTIYIGTATLTVQDSTLTVNGQTIGAQGAQGFQGAQGHQGEVGAQGDTGAQGFQGHQGAQGSQGDAGAQGFQGHQGDVGSQGSQGDTGAQGFQGDVGAQGVQGGFANNQDAIVATLTATVKLDVTTGTNINRSLVIGGEGVQGDGYHYASVAGTNSALLFVSNQTAGTQGRATFRTYGQNQPSAGATTTPVSQIILEGSRGTNTSPTALGNGDAVGGVSFGGYDGSRWSLGDRNIAPGSLAVNAAEAWAGNSTTSTNAGVNWTFRSQPIGMQLNSTSRLIWVRTLQSSVSGAPPTTNLVFNDNGGTTPTLTTADGSTTYTGHGRLNLGFINAQTTVIAVPSTDSSPDNNNLTGTNVVNYYGVRKNGMSGRRNRLQSGDSIFNILFTGATADNSTSPAGTQFASIIASVIENVSSTAYGSRLSFRTATSGTTNLSDRLRLDSELIQFGPTKSLQFQADEFSFREASGSNKTFANYTSATGGSYNIGLNNIQTFNITANEFYLKDQAGNAVIDYMTTTNKVDFVAPIEATTATITSILNLPVLTAEPAGKINGTIVFADGATWDPASFTNTQYLTWYDGANWKAIASV